VKDGSTMDAVLSVVAWSMNVLAEGCNPTQNHLNRELEEYKKKDGDGKQESIRKHLQGRAFATPWRGVALQMRGDWQWLCQCFHFPQWNCVANMCWLCHASNNGDLNWRNMTRNAGWRLR